jgi:hypothetical protein
LEKVNGLSAKETKKIVSQTYPKEEQICHRLKGVSIIEGNREQFPYFFLQREEICFYWQYFVEKISSNTFSIFHIPPQNRNRAKKVARFQLIAPLFFIIWRDSVKN